MKKRINTALLPRPHSYDRPKVAEYAPLVKAEIKRVSKAKRNGWRVRILANDSVMVMGHFDNKPMAESWAEGMLKTCAEVHYVQV